MTPDTSLLHVAGLTKRFGGLLANDAITLDMPQGGLYAVIGPNGAGKTTFFNMLAGSLAPSAGQIFLAGQEVTGQTMRQMATHGLIRTYQLVQLFANMTVCENVQVGCHRVTRGGVAAALLRPGWMRRQERQVRTEALEWLDFVGLADQAALPADRLPYGQQRLLEIARAMAAKPRLLLLDEPAAGLNTLETEALASIIRAIHARGVSVLLIEHDMSLVMQLAQRITVLDFGRKIAEGTPAEIQAHPDVLAAYLGGIETEAGATGAALQEQNHA